MITDREIDHRTLKSVFGTFATGVVVVTTDGPLGPAGVTCQTFLPLSLDPPLVGVCVSRTSASGARLIAEGRACFNILDRTAEALARRFAARGVDRFAGLDFQRSPGLGLPLLPQTIGWVDGFVTDAVPTGDHHLLVIRVAGLGTFHPEEPLTFFRGQFSHLRSVDE